MIKYAQDMGEIVVSKKTWLVILILALLITIRQCVKEDKEKKKIVYSKQIQKVEFTSKPNKIFIPKTYTTRMTSFYSGDECNTGSTTASGLSENDFDINEYGWYTYQDKLVIATASYRLKNWTMTDQAHPYNLYDELVIIIDGIKYDAIVLDVCGYCMWYNRIDLFVSNENNAIDKYVEVEL